MNAVDVRHGDSLAVLRTLPDASIDSCVCDPPYGLGTREPSADEIVAYLRGDSLDTGGDFMGRDWEIPPVALWREVFRVLKPGGHVLAFAGTRTVDLMGIGLRVAGFEFRDSLQWLYGQGRPSSKQRLKPGHEPILMFRKSTRGAEGLMGIDACRVTNGRWPANVVLSHLPECREVMARKVRSNARPNCADGCPVAMLDAQSGTLHTHAGQMKKHHSAMGYRGGNGSERMTRADVGGASRFFYCAKASRRERSAGLPEGVRNDWLTVKPVAVMEWLVRLVTPPGGIVLDPFAGSGTTGVAAARQGFRALLIDRDAHAVELSRARVAAALDLLARGAA